MTVQAAPIEQRMRVTPVYIRNAQAYALGWRIIANQGGTRSTKTYSIMQLFASLLQREYPDPLTITVTSHSLPHLKRGALRDFENILKDQGWYDEENINLTDRVYQFGVNYIEFFSADQPQKVRGPGRRILFINEANLVSYETFQQLAFRTTQTIFLDYNPADEHHWLYDQVLSRPDCFFIQSTYLEGFDFLPVEQVAEIERLREADPEYWKIYGLGERGKSGELIYTHWHNFHSALPTGGDRSYGLDLGFNVQTALVEIEETDVVRYAHEWLYETNLTTTDLLTRFRELGIDKKRPMYVDNAEPKTIEELKRAGYNAIPADKSVTDGIREVKAKPLYVTAESVNLQKELRGYKWKVNPKTGLTTDEPVKFKDHACDALRYGVYSHKLSKFSGPKPITKHRTLGAKK